MLQMVWQHQRLKKSTRDFIAHWVENQCTNAWPSIGHGWSSYSTLLSAGWSWRPTQKLPVITSARFQLRNLLRVSELWKRHAEHSPITTRQMNAALPPRST